MMKRNPSKKKSVLSRSPAGKVKLSDLVADNRNYNKGTEFGNSLIEKSLRENGAGRSILLDKNNRIIAGNKTVENAGAIGLDDVQIVDSDGTKIIAVRRTDIDLDSKEGRQMALADNASAKANIEWNLENLTKDWEVDELKDWGIEIKQEATEDDYDIPDEIQTDIVPGDLFEIGQHRLLCGDAIKAEDVEKLLDGNSPQLCISDPPYGMFLDTDFSKMKGSLQWIGAKNGTHGKKYDKIKGDNDDFTPELIKTIFENCNCKEIFLFGADYYSDLLPDLKKCSWIIWDKRKPSQSEAFGSEFEMIWSKQKHKRRILRHDWFGFLSSENQSDARNRKHPTQKPVTLISDIISQWGKGYDVIDLYGGVGSTMVATHHFNKRCYMLEIIPEYCQVIVDRMQKLDPSLEVKKNGLPYNPKEKDVPRETVNNELTT